MQTDYYGISIVSAQFALGWRWQVALPIGSNIITSDETFATAEQALSSGYHWLRVESAFGALNRCLSEICVSGRLHPQEHRSLMQSFCC
ncbi:MAG: hypothetical protein HC895_19455 [Leptolyngbyaceae cyanobacterium SM1_3_5]|nr:hypothetical protein [Leptolyngbyaceae cyanobacterium SM1_3_5]